MFGRLRPPSSSLDSLELERSHSKFFKDDSLSVYEATLMKLKRGSQLATTYNVHPPIDDPVGAEQIDCISSISSTTTTSLDKSAQPLAAANCSSSPISSSSSVCPSTVHLKHQPSVVDLFSKYKLSHQQSASSQTDITMVTSDDVDSRTSSQTSLIL